MATNRQSILIVEDEGLIAAELEMRLERSGYRVCGTAGSAQAALEILKREAPDLVLMDIRLQGPEDGIGLAGLMRRTPEIPVVFITAHADSETVARAKEVEPYGYLLKPITGPALASTVEIALYKHKLEQALRQQRAWLDLTLQAISDAVVVCDQAGAVRYINSAARSLLAVREDEHVGRPVADVVRLFWDFDGTPVASLFEFPGPVQGPFRFPAGVVLHTTLGNTVPVEGMVSRGGSPGGFPGLVVCLRDVTRNRIEEQEIRHDQKLSAIGRFAVAAAHDLDDFLTVVLAESESLARCNTADKARNIGSSLHSAATKASGLSRRLMQFAVNRPTRIENVNVAALVRSQVPRFRTILGSDSKLSVTIVNEDCCVQADTRSLADVLLTIVMNAKDSLPQGSSVEIQVSRIWSPKPDPNSLSQGFVTIAIREHGVGMTGAVADQFLDSYPATSSMSASPSLESAMVYDVLASFGGRLAVTSAPGEGALVEIFLPELNYTSQDCRPTAPRGIVKVPKKRILLVENEPDVRRVLHDHLQNFGYYVCPIADGFQALTIAELSELPFDVMVSSVVMPKIDGETLANCVRALLPDLQVILLGQARDSEAAPEGAVYLSKPIAPHDLRAVLERLMAAGKGVRSDEASPATQSQRALNEE